MSNQHKLQIRNGMAIGMSRHEPMELVGASRMETQAFAAELSRYRAAKPKRRRYAASRKAAARMSTAVPAPAPEPAPAPQGYVTLAQRGLVDRGHVNHRGWPIYESAAEIVCDVTPRATVLQMGVDNSFHSVPAADVLRKSLTDMAELKKTADRRPPRVQRRLLAQLRADGLAATAAIVAAAR